MTTAETIADGWKEVTQLSLMVFGAQRLLIISHSADIVTKEI